MERNPMTIEEAAGLVVSACRDLGIPIMVVGSLSSNFYGIPRATDDADFVVELGAGRLTKLASRLAPVFRFDPQPSFESITMTTKYLLEVVDHAFFVELFELSDDPFDRERFSRRREVSLYGGQVWLPTAEDVIVMKLRWYARGERPKDREDIRSVLAMQSHKLDWLYIESWCDRHGSREHLERLRALVAGGG
jgi:hypothetical protein